MDNYLNIVINEPYVKDLLQDLADKNAIQILEEDSIAADVYQVHQWQQDEVMRRMEELKKNPTDVYTWDEVKKMLENDEEM